MLEDNQRQIESMEINPAPNKKFIKKNAPFPSTSYSKEEIVNQKIQEQFYGKTEEDYLLPIHVDVSNPPIKK